MAASESPTYSAPFRSKLYTWTAGVGCVFAIAVFGVSVAQAEESVGVGVAPDPESIIVVESVETPVISVVDVAEAPVEEGLRVHAKLVRAM